MTGLIILAAGRSGRLGRPKQNLLFQNKTLLQRAVETAVASACRPIIVVTGAYEDLIEPVDNPNVQVVFNAGWEEGMASSIRAGIAEIPKHEDMEGALIMLCDQPFVTSSLIDEMLQKQHLTGKAIVACSYNNTLGVPVLFSRSMFSELLLLQGHEGAKKILKCHPAQIAEIPFEQGSIDIDTMEDYERLLNK